jgi:tetratricopeptide (TPR) repeat protein
MHPLLTSALRSHRHHPDPEINRLLDNARTMLEAAPALAEHYIDELIAGKTLAQCLGIANQALENSYQAACKLVNEKMFQEALVLASFVFAAQPKEARFAFKLASCLQHLEDVASAADFYKLSLQIDNHYIGAAYRLGECLHLLGEDEQAAHLFEWTIELARGNFAYRKIQAAAESRLRKQPLLP